MRTGNAGAQVSWSDTALLGAVAREVVTVVSEAGEARLYWIVDDTGFRKCGKHSVGVARQYCGRLGKTENCQVAVSLSLATPEGSLPLAYRLYLSREWAEDQQRRERAGVPRRAIAPARKNGCLWNDQSMEGFSRLPAAIWFKDILATVKLRWRIERDYCEFKQEVGLGHYEGRNWRGFHHHARLCIAVYGFHMLERLSGVQ